MIGEMEANRCVSAFDADAIHEGNRGLIADDEKLVDQLEALLDQMTLEQKLAELHGLQAEPIDGLYYAGGDESLGIPTYRMVDGPRGARAGTATAFPVAMARGATFDPMLEKRVGQAIGLEVAAKGGNVVLAPTINLLRHPGWGRAQETYSEDTCHMGAMGVAFVSGSQCHVMASPKHFAANNLEMTRFEMSANMDMRTLHEVYLPHFKRCVVEAGAASIMSAYNRLNGVYCGEHDLLLNRILREDWGFTGFVESDWFFGTRSTAKAINAGMDIEMPAAYRFLREKIDAAMSAGELTEATITRNAANALRQKLRWKLAELPVPDASVVESDEHLALAREAAEKSFVLLKNQGNLLPLEEGLRIAVIGELADTINLGDRGSSFVTSTEVVTPLMGLQATGNKADISYFASAGEAGDLTGFDVCVVVAGLTYREEGEFIPNLQQEAEGSGLARGGDRMDLRLPESQEQMIQQVSAAASRTIVLLEAGSAVEVTPWVDAVDALMMIWYPGCQGGHAVARVLFGEVAPSGRLPVSFPRTIDQLMPWDIAAMEVEHDLYHGYRYLDKTGADPLYPFGYGLTYTQFSLDGVQVERLPDGFVFNVSVTNAGAVDATAVPQLYVSYPDSQVERVVRELKGFGPLHLAAGETADLMINVVDEDLRYYDPADGWTLEACTYDFRIGQHAGDEALASAWHFDGDDWEPR